MNGFFAAARHTNPHGKRVALAAWTPLIAAACLVARANEGALAREETAAVTIACEEAAGRLCVAIDGREAIVYEHGPEVDLPHYYPVRSPSGKSMTVEHPDPYPHHRSFWFADKVQLDGARSVNFYGALYSGKEQKPPYADRVRHVKFLPQSGTPAQPIVGAKLLWEMDEDKPVLDELRTVRIVALGNGEYFLDFTFTVSAGYGNVAFTSDWVHYAWPYLRMTPAFSVAQGGTITNSEGGVNQAGTNGKPATWVDYTNTIDGETEGMAVFSHSENDHPHKWLTRDYGCFGPRRIDPRSGEPFTLKKGESLTRRVGLFVHRGNVKTAKVADRYEQYVGGSL